MTSALSAFACGAAFFSERTGFLGICAPPGILELWGLLTKISVLEDGQVEDVRKTMKVPAKSEEAPKTTEKSEPSKAAA